MLGFPLGQARARRRLRPRVNKTGLRRTKRQKFRRRWAEQNGQQDEVQADDF
jgi:hypothetical protein